MLLGIVEPNVIVTVLSIGALGVVLLVVVTLLVWRRAQMSA
jgi:hypothetical protein